MDLSLYRSFDTETYKFSAGRAAPKVVCASYAEAVVTDAVKLRGDLVVGPEEAARVFRELLRQRRVVFLANAAYDLAVEAQHDSALLAEIFAAVAEGRVHDILIAQSLDAIRWGHLGLDPRTGGEMRDPVSDKVTNRYSLSILTDIVLGRTDAKQNDVWRESYGLLDGIPLDAWPYEARQYPVDDAENTLEVGLVQIFGKPGAHVLVDVPAIPGVCAAQTICKLCGVVASAAGQHCASAPRVGPHQNLENLAFQVEADLAFKLGSAHSIRTDPEKVEELAQDVEVKHAAAVKRFQAKGWIRQDGSEDQAAVKRAVAVAYGARGSCPRCKGGVNCTKCGGTGKRQGTDEVCKNCDGVGFFVGKLRKIEIVDCRGEKERGRYQGCKFDGLGGHCPTCSDTGKLRKVTGESTCKNVFDEVSEVLKEEGCDGTGLDLRSAPFLPRTDKFGVGTDRDTKMESGDEDMADYGEDEFEKSRSTYLPYLRTGIDAPLWYSPNVLVATGRASYEHTPLHQMPRQGKERSCLRARGAWCGYPIETVFGSTDYEAGELCALAQYTYWLFGYSKMRDAINASGKPGILHSDLAAQVLGLPLDEFLVRLKNKDKQAVDFRQASKPYNFGKPAGMGSPKIVLTNRKKSAGFTVCEGGPAVNLKGEPGYWGIRFCILIGGAKRCGQEKVLEWKKKPCAPVCKACVEVVEHVLAPAYFTRYPEIKDYFDWVTARIDKSEPALSCVWDAEAQRPRIVRQRGGCDFSAFANNAFQSLLADVMKHAFVRATKECYLGVKADGTPSPLAGSRLPLVMHDEPLSELILETAHLSGPRIAEIMVESGETLAPHLVWKAETALAFWYSKSMEPVYDPTGNLVPWGPIPDYLQERFQMAA